MKIETSYGGIIVYLPCGKAFSIGIRGFDRLVVAQQDEHGRTINSKLGGYRDPKGEENLGEVRHIVLE